MDTFIETITEIFQQLMQGVIRMWQSLQRWYRNIRAHGTGAEKRAVWKLMHPAKPRRRKVRKIAA